MSTHYIEIVVDHDQAFAQTIFSRIIGILHATFKEFGESPIGTSFPYWQNHTQPSGVSLGKVIRLFGSRPSLLYFSRNAQMDDIANIFEVKMSAILPTPEDVDHVAQIRDRKIERYKKNQWPISKYLPYLKCQSKSNRKTFSLFVDMNMSDEKKEGLYSTYGFSKEGSTVPYF